VGLEQAIGGDDDVADGLGCVAAGAAQGVTYPGATTPALAKLVSSPTLPWRSKTVTVCPWRVNS
jgi:hypothetical protein